MNSGQCLEVLSSSLVYLYSLLLPIGSSESRSHCGTRAHGNVPVSHDRLNESTLPEFPMNLNLFSSDKVRDLTLLCTQLRGRFFSELRLSRVLGSWTSALRSSPKFAPNSQQKI